MDNVQTPMEDLTHLRKRLLYQSQRQGTREIDLLLEEFAAQYLASMTLAELKEFEKVINKRSITLLRLYLQLKDDKRLITDY